jgi:hypothetical protein
MLYEPMMKSRISAIFLPLAALVAAPLAASAQPLGGDSAVTADGPGYADVADLALASPVVFDATIRSAARIKGSEAAGVAPGDTRFYVEADVTALLKGPGAMPPRIGWLVDVPADAAGRTPKLKRMRVLVFARPVGAGDQVQLVSKAGQQPWSPALDARARAIVRESLATEPPPEITGIGNAFHVPGSLPGAGETQVFLTTRDSRPVSLTVLHRPGEQVRWGVALSEIVDDAAGPPARDTLLWYRLACALPPALPARSTETLSADDAARAREDYAFVIRQLGACERRLPPPR